MEEPQVPAISGTVQKYLGNKGILPEWAELAVSLGGWLKDGTLVFATPDADSSGDGLALSKGLAKPYQRQFERDPEVLAAIARAFEGERIARTVWVKSRPWDVHIIPNVKDGEFRGVVAFFADARARISGYRALNTLELQSQIRHDLVRSDSLDEFLAHCCEAIGARHPSVWIGLADRGEEKKLHIITSRADASRRFSSLNLSWDVGQKGGRHPAAEAVTLTRVQVIKDLANSSSTDMWWDSRDQWTSLIAVPLLAKGAAVGVLVIHSEDRTDFDDEMVEWWEKIASEIAEGIEILQAREERTRIMQDRQSAYQQYQQLLDTIFDIVVVHRAGRVIECNPAGVRLLLGAEKSDELVGMQVLALIDPADRERMKGALNESGSVDELHECRLLSLDGRSIDVEGVTVSIQHASSPARLSQWRDISQRKRSEAQTLQQKASLEYAQQLTRSGSVEFDVVSGATSWSRNSLEILGFGPDMQGKSFTELLSSVVVDKDRDEAATFIENILQHAKEFRCEVTLKAEDPANARTIRIQGVPQLEHHLQVPRVFISIQDVSQYLNAERDLKSKLLATRKLAKVVEWTYDIEKQIIVWEGNIKDFLGFDSPVPHLTYQQFMATIRQEDRELVRRSVEQSLKHGIDGEMVYEETFDQGKKMLLYGRWRPERNAAGRIVKLRGLSLDITNIRTAHERESRKERIHLQTGLPEKSMICDYVQHLTSRALEYNTPFSIIGIRIQRYADIKRHMANDSLYYQTQADIAREVSSTIPDVRAYGRLGNGCFVAVLSRPATQMDVAAVEKATVQGWTSALNQCDSSETEAITVESTAVHCPADGTEWEGILARLDKNLTP